MSVSPAYTDKLRRFYATRKRMPSMREIAEFLMFKSKNAAAYVAEQWIVAGLLEKDSAGRLVPGHAFSALKVLGTVEAGFPSPAEEELLDTISLDDWLIKNKESSFLLKVSGESMIDAGIHPGDLVILDRDRMVKDGDIVVAEVDRAWTIKFYKKNARGITLVPANKKFIPIIPTEELRVAGVVTAVIRKY